MALMQAATGVLKAASLYEVILEPTFASTRELKKMVEANLHFFTAKQQKALKESIKNSVVVDDQGTRDAEDRVLERGAERGAAHTDAAQRSRPAADLGDGGASTGAPSRGREPASSSRSPPRERPPGGPAGVAPGSRSHEDQGGSQPAAASKRRERREVADDSRSRSPVGHDERADPHSRGSRRGGGGGSRRRRRDGVQSRASAGARRHRGSDRSSSRGHGEGRRKLQADARRGGDPPQRGASERSDSRSSAGHHERRGAGNGPRRPARKDSREAPSPAPEQKETVRGADARSADPGIVFRIGLRRPG